MKVYELMNELKDMPCGATVKLSAVVSEKELKESMKCFEKALCTCKTVPEYLSKAISITKNYPDTCQRISWWKDGLWELIEDFLNTHPEDVDMEYFVQGCALLGE